jgi:hypothetical protein
MRKFFITAILLIAGAAGLFWLMRPSPSVLEAECAAYVEDAAVAISAHWSKGELLNRASSNLAMFMRSKPEEFDAFFENASAGLGPLRRYEGATGSVIVHRRGEPTVMAPGTERGKIETDIRASYDANAKYERGSATLRFHLSKNDGSWKIDLFNIDSADLISNLAKRKG